MVEKIKQCFRWASKERINSLVIIGACILWNHRNSCVFYGVTDSLAGALSSALEDCGLCALAGARGLPFLTTPTPTLVNSACLPKEEGGLGIINMRNQNSTLLIKFLYTFYNHTNIPWVELTWSKLYKNSHTPRHARSPMGSFWWMDVLKLTKRFRTLGVSLLATPTKAIQFCFGRTTG